MDALKSATIKRIKDLPDGVSIEDIMYEINFIGQVIDGIKDADKKRTITPAELFERVDKWGK